MADVNLSSEIQQLLKNFTGGISADRLQEYVLAIIIAIVGFITARLISNAFASTIGKRLNLHQKLIWRRSIFYFIFILFLTASLREAGFKLSVFLGAAGILTVALGFASQTSASNLISGLFLIGEGSFEIGDTIQLMLIRGQVIEGKVMSIGLLSVQLQTVDNTLIRVPNEQLIRYPVYNLTRFPIRRIAISLSIQMHENIAKVRKVLLETADSYTLILDEPRPNVTVSAIQDSSISILFTVWTLQKNFVQANDQLQERVRDAFIANQIQIPVPQVQLMDFAKARQTTLDNDNDVMYPR